MSSHFYVIDHVFTFSIVSLPVFAKEQIWAFEHAFSPLWTIYSPQFRCFSDIMGHILSFKKSFIWGIEYPFNDCCFAALLSLVFVVSVSCWTTFCFLYSRKLGPTQSYGLLPECRVFFTFTTNDLVFIKRPSTPLIIIISSDGSSVHMVLTQPVLSGLSPSQRRRQEGGSVSIVFPDSPKTDSSLPVWHHIATSQGFAWLG